MHEIYPNKKVDQLSKIIINLLYQEKVDPYEFFACMDKIRTTEQFISLGGTSYNTKKYRVDKVQICHISFMLKKQEAKRIKLYPWQRYDFEVYRFNFYKREKDLPILANDEIRSEDDTYLFTRIIFMSSNHNKRKKFEMKTFLRFLWKINPNNLFEVEKLLFEVTG